MRKDTLLCHITSSRILHVITRHWEWPPQDIVHLSLGVTTSKIMPLVGGLCHVQRTSHSSMGVTTFYDHAPRRRTLSRTTDFNPLGPHPSLEDFVAYNGLRPSGPTPLVRGCTGEFSRVIAKKVLVPSPPPKSAISTFNNDGQYSSVINISRC
jgi:hypothetical protein